MSTILFNAGQHISPANNQINWNYGGLTSTSTTIGPYTDSGYFYAPYIPMTSLVLDPNSFQPREGVMTRYRKKLIDDGARFYGKISVDEDSLYRNADGDHDARVPWQWGWDSIATIDFDEIGSKRHDLIDHPSEGSPDDSEQGVWMEPEERAAKRDRKVETGVAEKAPAPVRYVVPFKKGSIPSRTIHRGTHSR